MGNNNLHQISVLLVYKIMRSEKTDFDWRHINLVCKIHKTAMHAGVCQFFESLMFVYYMKQGMENVGQSAR